MAITEAAGFEPAVAWLLESAEPSIKRGALVRVLAVDSRSNDDIMQIARCTDAIVPFLLQRQRNPSPMTPYRPALPFGPYIDYGFC
jgi:hypothetical protein